MTKMTNKQEGQAAPAEKATKRRPKKAARFFGTVVKGARHHKGRTAAVAGVAIVAVVALALSTSWFLETYRSGAGRPVPVPRNVGVTQTSGSDTAAATQTEATLTIAPDMASRAGIKVEQVGEQLGSGSETGGPAATGVVQANTYRTTPVVSLVSGRLRQVGAEQGQYVQRGQTVAVVTSDELAMTQSRYLTALADLDEQQKHYKRTAQLVEIGAASREELEQANTKVKAAESEVASQRQRLLLLGLAPARVNSLRSSSQVSSEVSLPAPVSGTVITRSANPGEVIEANKEVLRVADLSSVWVIGQVYEKDLAKIRVGSGASITSDAYPGRVFRGRISYVDPSLDPATRTAQVRIELANPGQTLKLGMYVQIAFATIGGAESTTPVIPSAAVQNINNQQVVFVAMNDPNVFVMRPVRLGAESQGRFVVLEGLTVGDRIVTEGSFLLRAEWLKLNPSGASSSVEHRH
jgi:cobalt-zinc-cadmium efflux system membrane fusion protein